MGVREKGTAPRPGIGKLRPPGEGETPPSTSNLRSPSPLQHGWGTKREAQKRDETNISLRKITKRDGFHGLPPVAQKVA